MKELHDLFDTAHITDVDNSYDLNQIFSERHYDLKSKQKAISSHVLLMPNPVDIVSPLIEPVKDLLKKEGISLEVLDDQNVLRDRKCLNLNELSLLMETQIKTLELQHNMLAQSQIMVDRYLRALRESIAKKTTYFDNERVQLLELEGQIKEERRFLETLQELLEKQRNVLTFGIKVPLAPIEEGKAQPRAFSDVGGALPGIEALTEPPLNLVLPVLFYASTQIAAVGTSLIAAWLYEVYVRPLLDKLGRLRTKPKSRVLYEYVVTKSKTPTEIVISKHQRIEGPVEDVIRLLKRQSDHMGSKKAIPLGKTVSTDSSDNILKGS